ncbi:MAG: hypothetical protein JO112_05570, partial [Planctomycetes bacterium]|nr:hypothetical protein [Planctomycetota bacterium]
ALLLVGCYRSEEAAASPCLKALLGAEGFSAGGAERRELAVGTLAPAEAQALALALVGDGLDAGARAEVMARESGGHPLFVHELAQEVHAGESPVERSAGVATLEAVLRRRVGRLPESARRLLEVVAVAGAPLRRTEACPAAGLAAGEDRGALAVLRTSRLVRGTGPAEEEKVEPFHDRVRETVLAGLGAEVLAIHHRQLAQALTAAGHPDLEFVATHFQGAGEVGTAGLLYGQAADQAAGALAFERAARLYQQALELRPANDPAAPGLHARRGDALANAGRGAEAAADYLHAAAAPGEALDLRRRAAHQLLISGHVDEGEAVLRSVLRALGLRLAPSAWQAVLSILWHRVAVRLRGLRFRERPAAAVAPAELRRIDLCWSVAVGFGIIDPLKGMDYQSRHLLYALRAGEPYRVALGLTMEAAYMAVPRGSAGTRSAAYLAAAEALAERLDHPHALGLAALMRGVIAFHDERWQACLEGCRRAESILRDRCTGVTWELDSAQTFGVLMLIFLGRWRELAERGPVLLREARQRGDLLTVLNLNTYSLTVARLAADDPEAARRELSDTLGPLSGKGYHVQHQLVLMARAAIHLYEGRAAALWEQVQAETRVFRAWLLARVKFHRLQMNQDRAFVALAAALEVSHAEPFRQAAEQEAGQLEGERMPWAEALARYTRAALAAQRGDAERARRLLAEAADRYEGLDMALYAAATRRRLGGLLGGDDGRALAAQADARLTAEQVRNPARMTALLAPGFPD